MQVEIRFYFDDIVRKYSVNSAFGSTQTFSDFTRQIKKEKRTTTATENCDTYYWKANKKADEPESNASRLMFFIFALVKWFMSLIDRIRAK